MKKKGGNKEYNNGSIKCELDALQKNVVRNFLPHHLISGLFGQAGSSKDFMQLYYAVQQVSRVLFYSKYKQHTSLLVYQTNI